MADWTKDDLRRRKREDRWEERIMQYAQLIAFRDAAFFWAGVWAVVTLANGGIAWAVWRHLSRRRGRRWRRRERELYRAARREDCRADGQKGGGEDEE